MSQRRGKPLLTDKQWKLIEPSLPVRARSKMGGDAGHRRAGNACLSSIPAPRRAGDACRNGKRKGCGWTSGALSLAPWTSVGSWTGAGPSPLAISDQPKKRAWGWQNQAGERHKVKGGRRSRCSFGNPLGSRLPGGGEVTGTYPGQDCVATCGAESSTPETQQLIVDKAYDSDLLRVSSDVVASN
jgi:transposase